MSTEYPENDELHPCVFCGNYCKTEAEKEGMSNPILLNSPQFIVSPDFTPLIKGHLLIIPKKHIFSLSALTKDEYSKLMRIINLMNIFEGTTDLVFFEHGSVIQGYSGTSIDHAHLHILRKPEGFDWSYFEEYVARHNLGNPVITKGFPSYEILREFEIAKQPYIYVSMEGWSRIYPVESKLESQFLRKAFSPWAASWNWKKGFLSEADKALYEDSYEYLKQNMSKGGVNEITDIPSIS